MTPKDNDRERQEHPNLGDRPIDLRADLHGHVTAFAADDDMLWFEAHPGVDVRHRLALPHEWCDPAAAPACRPLFDLPLLVAGAEATVMVEVRQIQPGMRIRHPYYVVPGEAA